MDAIKDPIVRQKYIQSNTKIKQNLDNMIEMLENCEEYTGLKGQLQGGYEQFKEELIKTSKEIFPPADLLEQYPEAAKEFENMTDNDVKQMGASNIKSLKKLKTSYYDWVVFFDMHNLENELGIEHSNY